MPLVTTQSIMEPAAESSSAVGAFNAICLEHAEGIALGAEMAQRPVIIQISENAVKYHRGRAKPLVAACAAIAESATVPVSLHLDHVMDDQLFRQSVDIGVSSVMYDASLETYERNVARTAAAARWGHDHGLFIESELGTVGGKDGAHAPGVRTDPEDAARYVEATGVDALAVAVGSSHAMLKRAATLDEQLITQIARRVSVPLVLHGSSGVPDEGLAGAVRAGMVKVNIGTALNIEFTSAIRESLDADPNLVDPRKYLTPARDRIAHTVAHTMAVLARH